MTCFGMNDRHVDLILGAEGTEITVDAPNDMLDWCWHSNRPMITGQEQSDWLYSGKQLPDFKDYAQISREEYEKRACQACAGY